MRFLYNTAFLAQSEALSASTNLTVTYGKRGEGKRKGDVGG